MTKWEALIACRNHWQWLWITGSEHKSNYRKSVEWMHCCACCEYAFEVCGIDKESDSFRDCNICPLTGFAWKPVVEAGFTSFCDHDGKSFYIRWIDTMKKATRKKYASRMVYACNKAIEAMILSGEKE